MYNEETYQGRPVTMCMPTRASRVQPKMDKNPWSSPINPKSDTFIAACTASGEFKTSSNGLPEFVMSSSRDGTDAFAGDWGKSSAAWGVGTAAVDGPAVVASTAADGISLLRAAVAGCGVVAAVTSWMVEGSETGESMVDRFHGVQDRLRDDTAAKSEFGVVAVYSIGRLPRATYEG